MKRILAFICLTVLASVAQHAPVVKPRAQAKDYPAVAEHTNVTIGAAQLSAKQVRKTFVSNMRKDYLVVEIGLYPKNGLKISPADFVLHAADSDTLVAPADPNSMALNINEKDQQGTDVAIYPYEAITYTTGNDANDPYYRNGRPRGVSTTTGVAVEMKPNQRDPKTSAADTKAMIAELTEKSLPQGEITTPSAGFIYFPVNTSRPASYTLEYRPSDGTKVSLPLPAPAE